MATPFNDAQLRGARNFTGEADAAATKNAAFIVKHDAGTQVIKFGFVAFGVDGKGFVAVFDLVVLQTAFTGFVAYAAIHRMVQGDELHDCPAGGANRLAVGFDLHAGGDGQIAGWHKLGTAVDLDQADAAVAGDGEAGMKAEVGYIDSVSKGCFSTVSPSRVLMVWLSIFSSIMAPSDFQTTVVHGTTVFDVIVEFRSEFRDEVYDRHGGGVTQAQTVLPMMPLVMRSRLSMSPFTPLPATMRLMMSFIQALPSRQGVHWPQDSWA